VDSPDGLPRTAKDRAFGNEFLGELLHLEQVHDASVSRGVRQQRELRVSDSFTSGGGVSHFSIRNGHRSAKRQPPERALGAGIAPSTTGRRVLRSPNLGSEPSRPAV